MTDLDEQVEDRVDRYKDRWDREMREHLADPPQIRAFSNPRVQVEIGRLHRLIRAG